MALRSVKKILFKMPEIPCKLGLCSKILVVESIENQKI